VERSGPCLIKFFQWASTRPDVFSTTFCQYFSKLHADAPAHSLAETTEALQLAFGEKSTELSDLRLVGSGCVASVYEATLNSRAGVKGGAKGQRVAVKVIHPSARDGIQRDLRVLALSKWLEWLFPSLKFCSISDSVRVFNVYIPASFFVFLLTLPLFLLPITEHCDALGVYLLRLKTTCHDLLRNTA
jgi:aarF domain-containing kinase